jgi:hypothetical protein
MFKGSICECTGSPQISLGILILECWFLSKGLDYFINKKLFIFKI